MPLILGTNSIKDTGYNVANSVRYNDDDSPSMTKASTTVTNDAKFTISAWCKRSTLNSSGEFGIFGHRSNSNNGNNNLQFGFYNDSFYCAFVSNNGSDVHINKITTAVYRDTSSWYHVMVAVDSSQGTAGNRARVYVNGTEITSFSTDTNPANGRTFLNDACNIDVGRYTNTSGTHKYFDGYLAEVVYIDGLQLTPTSFGEFDEDTNIWKPKDVSDLTFGNNGFYLDFEDSSNLGNDANGGTDLTESNLTSIDQSTDTCTNNTATMNPLAITNSANTFSEGNLKITTTSSASSYNQATIGVSSGKWYWEVKYVSDTDGSSNYARIGIADIDPPSTGGLGEVEGIAYEAINGNRKIRGTPTSYGDTYAPGDIIGIALNLDDDELTFYKNGTAQNSGTAIDISSYTPKTGFWHPAFGYDDGSHSGVFEANFGNPTFSISSGNSDGNGYGNFEYSVPSGYHALNTKNLAEYG